MNASELQKLSDWLIDGARSAAGSPRLLAEICERLIEAGLPLWRIGVFVRTLHPDVFGRNFIWRPGAEVEVGAVDFEILQSPDFHASPLIAVFQQGIEVRARVDDPASSRFPIIADLRAEGVTDYIALPLTFTDGLGPCLELDHEAARRLHRRAAGGAADDRDAVGAPDRDHQSAPHGFDAARHLCRQPRRRADHGRPDSPRPHRDHECRDLAVGSARLHRAVGPAAVGDGGGHSQPVFRLPGGRDPRAWRRSAEIYGRRAARGVSDRRICRRCPAGLQSRAGSRPSSPAPASPTCDYPIGETVERFRFGLALHVGTILYGNIGGGNRLDFTCIGPAVNLAARLEKIASQLHRTVVASEGFAGICGGGWSDLGEFPIAGFSKAERVYGLIDETSAA